jgi:hypothetical protein
LLKGGDTKAMLAEALGVATRFAKGYRLEYADEPEEVGAAPVVVPPVVVGRSPFAQWRA